MKSISRPFRRLAATNCLGFAMCFIAGMTLGCSRTNTASDQAEPSPTGSSEIALAPTIDSSKQADDAAFVFEPAAYEASAEQLLASRLPIDETTEGWVRLFDGHTLFGWGIAGEANWQVTDGAIAVDRGKACLLTTSTLWSDFELRLEFKADASTNSGVFVRTTLDPKDVTTECFEINIAPPENPFPTGSVVKRKKAPAFEGEADQWHQLAIHCDGDKLSVHVNDVLMSELDDAKVPSSGYIGLQHNSGKVAFRDIRIRPLGLTSLLDAELNQWTQYEDMPGDFTVDKAGHLVVSGGKQQLESKERFGDFALLLDYQMDDAKSNSGVFFRSIPGDVMMGYECQVNNELKDGNPLTPADCGVGGIFRRQDARVVAGEPKRWNSILLLAHGNHFATWVNGLQVADVMDERDPHENPRKGLRLDPGTLIIQGHDPTTKASYRQFAIRESE